MTELEIAKEDRKNAEMAQMLADRYGVKAESDLRRLWSAYTSPQARTLALVLGDVQKEGYPRGYSHWEDFVVDVMAAMELHDAGQFPEEWLDQEDDQ